MWRGKLIIGLTVFAAVLLGACYQYWTKSKKQINWDISEIELTQTENLKIGNLELGKALMENLRYRQMKREADGEVVLVFDYRYNNRLKKLTVETPMAFDVTGERKFFEANGANFGNPFASIYWHSCLNVSSARNPRPTG